MNGETVQFDRWKSVLDYKASLLYSQIARVKSEFTAQGTDADLIEEFLEPYYASLKSLYTEDYALAEALENSDLVVRIEGRAVDKDSPRVSVVSSYFGKVRTQVTKIAKALANLDDRQRRLPKEFDLTISAFAKGSLILGFSLPTTQDLEEESQVSLFGVNDPLYLAARNAMKTLGVVSKLVIEDASTEALAEAVPDAKVRDIALSAVRELAPSGRTGVSSVAIAGKGIGNFDQGKLTRETRSIAQKAMKHPVESDEIVTFHGQIREIDLDARRFELRHVEHLEANEVRCIYDESHTDSAASKWINKLVTVSGRVERDANGKARLMEIQTIEY